MKTHLRFWVFALCIVAFSLVPIPAQVKIPQVQNIQPKTPLAAPIIKNPNSLAVPEKTQADTALRFILDFQFNCWYAAAGEDAAEYSRLVIPSTWEGLPVRYLWREAFKGLDSLEEIVLPDTLYSIGSEAFKDCSNLVSINIPASVTSIGSRAFQGCEQLTTIELPERCQVIPQQAFSGCSSLESIYFSPQVRIIETAAFEGCESLLEDRKSVV